MPAVPMIDDLELTAVQQVRQESDQDFVQHRIAGLDGRVHQKLGRRSHRVLLRGLLLQEGAAEDLEKLQQKATDGAEVTFVADIASALAVDKMVIESLVVQQDVGLADQYGYSVVLAESPPLPPPAELSAFGGLDGFGLGDLGFDPSALGDVLSEIQDAAGDVMGALDSALDALEGLSALAGLGDLSNLGNPLAPMTEQIESLGDAGPAVGDLGDAVGNLLGGGG